MTARRTLRPYPDGADREIHIVVDDEQAFWIEAVPMQQRAHGFPARIHERLGLCQHDAKRVDVGERELGPRLIPIEHRAARARQGVDAAEARIVARARVLVARIAESDDEPIERGRISIPAQAGEGIPNVKRANRRSGRGIWRRSFAA